MTMDSLEGHLDILFDFAPWKYFFFSPFSPCESAFASGTHLSPRPHPPVTRILTPSNTPAMPDPNPPVDGEDTEVLDDGTKNILMGIISQLGKSTDLHRVTLPTFVLEPRSMLERITDFMSHPELINK